MAVPTWKVAGQTGWWVRWASDHQCCCKVSMQPIQVGGSFPRGQGEATPASAPRGARVRAGALQRSTHPRLTGIALPSPQGPQVGLLGLPNPALPACPCVSLVQQWSSPCAALGTCLRGEKRNVWLCRTLRISRKWQAHFCFVRRGFYPVSLSDEHEGTHTRGPMAVHG